MDKRQRFDVLVAGTGIAGLTCAIHCREAGLSVLVITKEDRVEESNTNYAQGGIIAWREGDAPETLAASRNAARGRAQVSLNLAYGSAIASIGLTVPAIVIATFVLDKPLVLGLEPVHMMLLALTGVVSVLTVVPGRATRLQGALHLCLLAAFVFLTAVP